MTSSKKTKIATTADARAFEQLANACEILGHGRHTLASGWVVTIKRDPAHGIVSADAKASEETGE